MKTKQLELMKEVKGLCKCGCGQPTKIAYRNRKQSGWVQGQPLDYVVGHSGRIKFGPRVPTGMKWCARCDKVKDHSEFYKISRAKPLTRLNIQPHCKECGTESHRKWAKKNRARVKYQSMKANLKRNFNLTMEQFNTMLEEHNNSCAICGRNDSMNRSRPQRLGVDHNKTTGKIRGLLCNNCNRGIGLFHDDIEYMQKTIEYLKKHSE